MTHAEINDRPFSLHDLIKKASGWYPEEGGYRVYYSGDYDLGIPQGVCWVANPEIDDFHPHLGHVLAWLAAEYSSSSGPARCNGVRVRHTIQEWFTPLRLAKTDNSVDAIGDIFEIAYRDTDRTVMLSVEVYDIYSNNVNGVAVFYAGKSFRDKILVDNKILDEKFPGWLTRFKMASQLDFQGKNLVNLVLTAQSQNPEITLNNLDFD